jgi:hypothetical protein
LQGYEQGKTGTGRQVSKQKEVEALKERKREREKDDPL